MKITFEELLEKASENLKVNGKELSKQLIEIFCIPGVKKKNKSKGFPQQYLRY